MLAILTPEGFAEKAEEQDPVGVVLDRTSYYAEQGGQVADFGGLKGARCAVTVSDCQAAAGYVLHMGSVAGSLAVGDEVECCVDYVRRAAIVPNHTFTHVLNFALRETLGDGVDQKGSIVKPDMLRFDFSHRQGCTTGESALVCPSRPHRCRASHPTLSSHRIVALPASPHLFLTRSLLRGPLPADELAKVEAICRDHIARAMPIFSAEVPLAQAREIEGLRAVFGETYPDPVRVVSVGRSVDDLLSNPKEASNRGFSIEFCGGTHLSNTSEGGAFVILSEEAVAKGIRRIVAVMAQDAEAAMARGAELEARVTAAEALDGPALAEACAALREAVDTATASAVVKVALRERIAAMGKRVAAAAKAAAAEAKRRSAEAALAAAAEAQGRGEWFAVVRLADEADGKMLVDAWTAVSKAHPSFAMAVASRDPTKQKVLVLTGVTDDLKAQLDAGKWLQAALDVLQGKGGGKPNVAQGQGTVGWSDEDAAVLGQAMEALTQAAQEKLKM